LNTIFPDLELILVDRVKDALALETDPSAEDVFVSVKKPPPNLSPYPGTIVTIRSQGSSTDIAGLLRTEGVGVNIYAQEYGAANTLARIVESVMRNIVGGTLKRIDAISAPTRVTNDGNEEQRYLTFNVIVMAQDK
jgi:hypothetical protein